MHQSESWIFLVLIFMRVNTVPRCCWGFLAGIVGTPLQKITKRPKWRTRKNDPSGVKRKRVAKDFSVEEVIRLMEDEEFSAWCKTNLSDESPYDDDNEGTKLQRGGGGHVVDKISYFQLIHKFPLC